MEGTETSSPRPARKRITKACDQCNRSRSKCDGASPCTRCRENVIECSYERVSRRQGRVSKAMSRRSIAEGTSASSRERPLLEANAVLGRPAGQVDRFGYSASPNMMTSGSMQFQTGSGVPTAWFTNETSYGDIYGEPNWFGDAWTPTYDALRLSGAHQIEGRLPTLQSLDGMEGRSQSSERTLTTLRYPVLDPLMPYLSRLLSPALACDLLEAYLSDIAEGIPSPSSPLLLAHVFRKESMLSSHSPRQCTPSLLASMLLVSAHTTEFPFFGSSPSARDKLQSGLLRLSLALMDRLPGARDRRPAAYHNRSEHTDKASFSTDSRQRPQFRRPRAAYIDDIVTYMHIALVTMTTESKPPGVHWWHTAIQLAKEYRLNRDPSPPARSVQPVQFAPSPNNTSEHTPHDDDNDDSVSSAASPMSVSDDVIVEHSKAYPSVASSEESEERRRVWWLLYIWDRHLAIRYNSPLSIKDAESQDVYLPLDDAIWQDPTVSQSSTSAGQTHDQRGPPSTIRGGSIFDVLVPLMCILGQIIDMHHVAYHPRVERSSSNPVADAYTATISQQLRELEPSIVSLEMTTAGLSMSDSANNRIVTHHKRLLISHARFLRHLLYVLLGGQWDKLSLSERIHDYVQARNFSETMERSFLGGDCLNDILSLGPDFGFKAMVSTILPGVKLIGQPANLKHQFFGIFIYHGSTLPWAVTNHFKGEATARMMGTCDIYVRAFEALNTTYQTEYLRKMRKLVLLTLKEIRFTLPLSKEEQHLKRNIIKLYRWTGDGTGLGL